MLWKSITSSAFWCCNLKSASIEFKFTCRFEFNQLQPQNSSQKVWLMKREQKQTVFVFGNCCLSWIRQRWHQMSFYVNIADDAHREMALDTSVIIGKQWKYFLNCNCIIHWVSGCGHMARLQLNSQQQLVGYLKCWLICKLISTSKKKTNKKKVIKII